MNEKTMELNSKEINDKISSPYTMPKVKSKKLLYVLAYLLILVLVVLAVFWSVNQITVDKNNAYVVSYRK